MCGIAGQFYRDRDRSVGAELLGNFSRTLAHRGPDDEGVFVGAGVGLVHRRLSIIDLAGGHQPIGNEDQSIQVVLNGEIYNYRELARDLRGRGHTFRTNSDTEVLVHLYEELGARMVEPLRGMFAFALWDQNEERILLARDRVGIKPLYVLRSQTELAFASELDALIAHPSVSREIDPRSLESYLAYGFVPGRGSILRGIERLMPGHLLTLSRSHWSSAPKRYWKLDFDGGRDVPTSEAGWLEAVDRKLDESVAAHLVSDVPVGAFLSGGVDSSLIAAKAQAQMKAHGETLKTFSIGFEDPKKSELEYARAVAEHLQTEHHEQILRLEEAAQIEEIARTWDEPFADSSAVATLKVARLAREHVKVTLSGDGGDEAFGGYARYQHDLFEERLRRALPDFLRPVAGALGRRWPDSAHLPRPLRARSTLLNLADNPANAYARTLASTRERERRALLTRDVRESLININPSRAMLAIYRNSHATTLGRMQRVDLMVLLPDAFLTKVDRASMSTGLEVRPPLLDHRLLQLTAAMPDSLKIKNGKSKYLLQTLARRYVPPFVIDRPKRGFDLPLAAWFRERRGHNPLRGRLHELVFSSRGPLDGLVDHRYARHLLDRHLTRKADHAQTLWTLLVLSAWCREHLRTPASTAETTQQTAIA